MGPVTTATSPTIEKDALDVLKISTFSFYELVNVAYVHYSALAPGGLLYSDLLKDGRHQGEVLPCENDRWFVPKPNPPST